MTTRTRIPVTILTGFLGAGKSSLLRHLLNLSDDGNANNENGNNTINGNTADATGTTAAAPTLYRIAVIQNETTEMDVEESLIESTEQRSYGTVLQLKNGCVCCNVASDLARALSDFALSNQYEHIIVEASGLSDPASLIERVWVDTELEFAIYLDGVVCVIDVAHIEGLINDQHMLAVPEPKPIQLKSGPTNTSTKTIDSDGSVDHTMISQSDAVIRQLVLADVILLNKCDLVTGDYAQEWKQNISEINPTAKIYCTVRSQIDRSAISPIRAYEGEVAVNVVNELLANRLNSPHIQHSHSEKLECCHSHSENSHHHTHHDPSDHHLSHKHTGAYSHTHHIDSLTFENQDPTQRVSSQKLKDWLAELLWTDMYMNTQTLEEKLHGTKSSEPKSDAKKDNIAPMKIFRMKGILHMEDEDTPHFLQCVQQLFDISEGKEWPEGLPTKHMTRILIMGVGVETNKDRLQKRFDSIFVSADNENVSQ